jgi:hypothetical protein
MGQIMLKLQQFFRENSWSFMESQDKTGLMLKFGGRSGKWNCYAEAREPRGQLVFYSYAPVDVPEASYSAVIEYLTRANFGLGIGDFEFNFLSGTVQFKTSIDVTGEESNLSLNLIKHLVFTNVVTMDKYLPGLQSVLEGKTTPEQAIARIDERENG